MGQARLLRLLWRGLGFKGHCKVKPSCRTLLLCWSCAQVQQHLWGSQLALVALHAVCSLLFSSSHHVIPLRAVLGQFADSMSAQGCRRRH